MAEYLFHEGTNYHSHKFLGSFLEGDTCTFRVWAPNAKRVFVTGEFCSWYPYTYEMKKINDRGIYEVKWIIEEKKLYQSIFENFEDNILSKNSIVNEEYKEEDFSQNQYLIKTFSNKLWKELDEETIVNFLNGLDFYYLSNEAYFFIIPACIRYGIEKFENNEDLEYLLFFLSDRDRVKYANDKIKKLVVSYLELLKKLKFLVFGREEEKCLEIWR